MPFDVPAYEECAAIHLRLAHREGGGCALAEVPLSEDAQRAVLDMLRQTKARLDAAGDGLPDFELSDGGCGACRAKLDAEWAATLRDWHEARGVPLRPELLADLDVVKFMQLLVLTRGGATVSAVKPARSARGLARKRRLILLGGRLELQTQPTLALDDAFDVAVARDRIYALSRSSLDQVCEIDRRLVELAPRRLEEAGERCPGIAWSAIAELVQGKTRATRALFAVASRADLSGGRLEHIRARAAEHGIELVAVGDAVCPAAGPDVLRFLMLVDGRFYIDDIGEQPRRFLSLSRRAEAAMATAARRSAPPRRARPPASALDPERMQKGEAVVTALRARRGRSPAALPTPRS